MEIKITKPQIAKRLDERELTKIISDIRKALSEIEQQLQRLEDNKQDK